MFDKEIDESDIDSAFTKIIEKEDIVSDYLRTVSKYPLLSAKEEKNLLHLWIKARNIKEYYGLKENNVSMLTPEEREIVSVGEAAREKLITHNLRLVIYVVKHQVVYNVNYMDLIQDGNMGLMRALDKFDVNADNKFSTYAVWWIREFIQRGLYRQMMSCKISESAWRMIPILKKTIDRLKEKNSTEPSLHEIAKAMNTTPQKVLTLMSASEPLLYLDSNVSESSESVESVISDENSDTESSLVRSEMEKYINEEIMSVLPEKNRFVISRRFGFGGEDPATLEEIGRELGVTRERIRQIEARSLDMLRTRLLKNDKDAPLYAHNW